MGSENVCGACGHPRLDHVCDCLAYACVMGPRCSPGGQYTCPCRAYVGTWGKLGGKEANNDQGQRGAAGATSIVQEGRTGFAGMRVQSPLAQSLEPPPLARILLILLIPTFLLGCQLAEDVFGKPWEKAYTLSQAVKREAKRSVSARYYRIDTATASVVFTNQYGDQTKFALAWPVEWGVIIMANDIRTENGADPVILREKYIGNF